MSITDTSLTHHDSQPYFLPQAPAIQPIDFSPHLSASSWMKPLPTPSPPTSKTLVELPCNWYMEDSTSYFSPVPYHKTNMLPSDSNAIPPRSTQLPRLRDRKQHNGNVEVALRISVQRVRRRGEKGRRKRGFPIPACVTSGHKWHGSCDWHDRQDDRVVEVSGRGGAILQVRGCSKGVEGGAEDLSTMSSSVTRHSRAQPYIQIHKT